MLPPNRKRALLDSWKNDPDNKYARTSSPIIKTEPVEYPQHEWNNHNIFTFSAETTVKLKSRNTLQITKVTDYSGFFRDWRSNYRKSILHKMQEWIDYGGNINRNLHVQWLDRYLEVYTVDFNDERVGLRGQLGVKAKGCIPKGTPLGLYVGKYLTDNETDDNDHIHGSFHTQSYYFDTAHKSMVISAWKCGNILSLVNANSTHGVYGSQEQSDNIAIVYVVYKGWPYVVYMAMADIYIGQELLVDYGANYWNTKGEVIEISDDESESSPIQAINHINISQPEVFNNESSNTLLQSPSRAISPLVLASTSQLVFSQASTSSAPPNVSYCPQCSQRMINKCKSNNPSLPLTSICDNCFYKNKRGIYGKCVQCNMEKTTIFYASKSRNIEGLICQTCSDSYHTHTCDVCQKGFTTSGSLAAHKLTHTGVKPYTCDVCQQGFTQSGNLASHKLTHSGVKPYTCDVCQQGFTTSGNLARHKQKKHNSTYKSLSNEYVLD